MPPLPKQVDILIVGAGPVGLTLAAELQKSGASFVIIDRQAAGANTSRAAVIHARTLEVLEGIGATQPLIARGLKAPTFRVRDRDRLLASIKFQNLDTRYPFTLMCPQDETEAVLLDRLVRFGGEVIRPAVMEGVTLEGDGVLARVTIGGQQHAIQARYIVGCDGLHSTVREQSGISFDGASYQEDFVLADVRMIWPLCREEVNLFFSPAGLVVVAPLPGGDFRIVATAHDAPETPSVAFLQGLLDARGPQSDRGKVSTVLWGSRFHVHHRVAQSPRRGPFLLCGDAAHVHSPAGGQGMNTGIQDAAALVSPLLAALGSGGDAGLDAWADQRHQIARKVVALTDRLTRAATLTSWPAQRLSNTARALIRHVPAARNAIARNLAELDYR